MSSYLKVIVELTVENPAGPPGADQISEIKRNVEEKIGEARLATYMYSLGQSYTDAEVISVKYIEEHDAR